MGEGGTGRAGEGNRPTQWEREGIRNPAILRGEKGEREKAGSGARRGWRRAPGGGDGRGTWGGRGPNRRRRGTPRGPTAGI